MRGWIFSGDFIGAGSDISAHVNNDNLKQICSSLDL